MTATLKNAPNWRVSPVPERYVTFFASLFPVLGGGGGGEACAQPPPLR